MTIGQKIKIWRKKRDLTQEKLADYLCVSYQAVSKWETGVSSPDLSMIAPLTKLLQVSADELLGLNEAEFDSRRGEIQAAYDATWQTGDLEERYKVAETAVKEYPGDMKYLNWLAWAEAMRSFKFEDHETYVSEQEKAIKYFATVIEDCNEESIRNSAIQGITQYLSFRGRIEEAKKYAEQYPDELSVSKDDLHACFLTGSAAIAHRQQRISRIVWKLLNLVMEINTHIAFDTAENLIDLFVPDGNYLHYHADLMNLMQKRTNMLLKENRHDEAIEAIKKALHHAKEYDKIAVEQPGVYYYTAPLLDKVFCDTNKLWRSGTTTQVEDIQQWLTLPQFNPLRDREDFREIMK